MASRGITARWAIGAAGALLLAAVGASAPEAARAACAQGVGTVTVTYSTAGSHEFVVPDHVNDICVEAHGARGGSGGGGGSGGMGGYAEALFEISPGTTLTAVVGGAGTARLPGSNGGGAASSNDSGGGGGASDLRTGGPSDLASRLIVAGGGGGAAQSFINGGQGGSEPGGGGQGGGFGGTAFPGGAGTQSKGGDGGTGGGSVNFGGGGGGGGWGGGGVGGAGGNGTPSAGGSVGQPGASSTCGSGGSLGTGGTGSISCTRAAGGGGGYYGGGAGGTRGGGGGGSSFVHASAASASMTAGTSSTAYVRIVHAALPAPVFDVVPATKDFGAVRVGATTSQGFTVTNTGTAVLEITSVSLTGGDAEHFTIVSAAACEGTLSAAETCDVEVDFTPGSTGAKSATLSFEDNADGSPHTVALTGTGVVPAFTIAPASKDFGSVRVDTAAPSQTFIVTNTGTADLTFSSVSLTGADAAQFSIGSSDCAGTLAPDQACGVQVGFGPTSTGAKAASLTVVDDAPGSPHPVALTGAGVMPGFSIAPAAKDFGLLRVVSTASQSFTVTNTGDANLTITGVSLDGADAGQFGLGSTDDCVGTVAPDQTCAVEVDFTPTSTGAKAASLTFADDADGAPHTVSLAGTATDPGFTIDPVGPYAYGSHQVGTSTAAAYTVTNDGTSALMVGTPTVDGAGYALTGDTCSAGSVGAGDTCTITVTFAPTTTGLATGTLTVPNDDDGPATVTLTGTGTPAPTPPTPPGPSPMPPDPGPTPPGPTPPGRETGLRVGRVSGVVRILVGGRSVVARPGPLRLPARMDTSRGAIMFGLAVPGGWFHPVTAGGGRFAVDQVRVRGARGNPDRFRIRLLGGSMEQCARVAADAPASRTTRRHLTVKGYGRLSVRGRTSVARIAGQGLARWETRDRCDGTLTRVLDGTVRVRDPRRKRTIVLRAGQSYLVRASRPRRAARATAPPPAWWGHHLKAGL